MVSEFCYYYLCCTPEEKINGTSYICLEDDKWVKVQNPTVYLNGYESNVHRMARIRWPLWANAINAINTIIVSTFGDNNCTSFEDVGETNACDWFKTSTWQPFNTGTDIETMSYLKVCI